MFQKLFLPFNWVFSGVEVKEHDMAVLLYAIEEYIRDQKKSIIYLLKNRDAAIEEMAYELWEIAGKPNGDGVDFWLKAEQTYDENIMTYWLMDKI